MLVLDVSDIKIFSWESAVMCSSGQTDFLMKQSVEILHFKYLSQDVKSTRDAAGFVHLNKRDTFYFFDH